MKESDRREFTDFYIEFTEFKGDVKAEIAPMKESIDRISKWGVWFCKLAGAAIFAACVSSVVADYNAATTPLEQNHNHEITEVNKG